MSAHFDRQCEVVAALTHMVPTCEVFQVHGQPPQCGVHESERTLPGNHLYALLYRWSMEFVA